MSIQIVVPMPCPISKSDFEAASVNVAEVPMAVTDERPLVVWQSLPPPMYRTLPTATPASEVRTADRSMMSPHATCTRPSS